MRSLMERAGGRVLTVFVSRARASSISSEDGEDTHPDAGSLLRFAALSDRRSRSSGHGPGMAHLVGCVSCSPAACASSRRWPLAVNGLTDMPALLSVCVSVRYVFASYDHVSGKGSETADAQRAAPDVIWPRLLMSESPMRMRDLSPPRGIGDLRTARLSWRLGAAKN